MLRTLTAFCAVVAAAAIFSQHPARAAELTTKEVLDQKGDGPDGQGNTADDTWQFWFQLVHNPNQYGLLDRYSADVPKAGIPRKVTGPVASKLPNPDDTVGWIYHSDWDGRFEGVWADKKTNSVIAYPYVEKRSHCAVAVTYKVPEDGKYTISGTVTDMMVEPFKGVVGRLGMVEHDGVELIVEIADGANRVSEVGRSKAIGDDDKKGSEPRPDSDKFEFKGVELKKGQLVRFVIHPRKWWGSDLTKLENLKIEKE